MNLLGLLPDGWGKHKGCGEWAGLARTVAVLTDSLSGRNTRAAQRADGSCAVVAAHKGMPWSFYGYSRT